MSSIREILSIERGKQPGTVLLFEEGLFLKAYEESACRLAQQYGFKVSCRSVKRVGEMVISVGFPKTSSERFLPQYHMEEKCIPILADGNNHTA